MDKPTKLSRASFLRQTDWDCGLYEFPTSNPLRIHFNCSYTEWQGCEWLVTRNTENPLTRAARNTISFWKLSDNKPVEEFPVRFRQQYPDEHFEDPRIVSNTGLLVMSWANLRPRSFAHQVIGEVSVDCRVENPIRVQYGRNGTNLMKNRGHEKNWVWFWHGDELCAIYTVQPHVIIKPGKDDLKNEIFTTETDLKWNYGEVRGGSPPVRVGDEFICFFHSSIEWKPPFRKYVMGAYAFEVHQPFKVTRITKEPLLVGSDKDPMMVKDQPVVIFPCGAVLKQNMWMVTFGCNDCRSAWIKIPAKDLNERMIAV